MRIIPYLVVPALAGAICLLTPAHRLQAKEEVKKPAKVYEIPYKLTIPKHIVVRLKFNGKGPYNFILDTGAPALFIATKVAEKAGLVKDAKGWGTIDKLEIEGGLTIEKARGRIETPFQLEGMNGMGLAGLEIHGMIGYQVLAGYRMEIDFTRDKMVWTELEHKAPLPTGMGGKGGGPAGLAMFGSIMKGIGSFLGRKATPEVVVRGFYGMTLVNGDEFPKVEAVLDKGPAGESGLRVGDLITKVKGRTVTTVSDVLYRAGRLPPGGKVSLTIKRGSETKEITFTTSEGI